MIHGAERANKKVLMIAYAFPPLAGSGVQRTLKFAKFLPRFGWIPIVLTCDATFGGYPDEFDPTLLDEFPSAGRIIRARALQPLSIYRRLVLNRAKQSSASKRMRMTGVRTSSGSHLASVLAKAKQLYREWLCIPDEYIGWFPLAVWKGFEILRLESIDAVWSTSDPYTDHLLGYVLSALANKPWVADFRDPWTQNAQYRYTESTRKRLDECLEFCFLRHASRVVVTTPTTRDNFLAKYPGLDASEFVSITNGFDEDDFDGLCGPAADNKKFTITYSGRFNHSQNSSPLFLHALSELLDEGIVPEGQLQAIFVGAFGEENHGLVERLQLEGIVRSLGYLPHRESLRHVARSTVLLLTLNPGDGREAIIPGKVFEYLAARKPILGLVPEGSAAELLRNAGLASIVHPQDKQGIKQEISRMYSAHIHGTLDVGSDVDLGRFTRSNLTRDLAALLDETIE